MTAIIIFALVTFAAAWVWTGLYCYSVGVKHGRREREAEMALQEWAETRRRLHQMASPSIVAYDLHVPTFPADPPPRPMRNRLPRPPPYNPDRRLIGYMEEGQK